MHYVHFGDYEGECVLVWLHPSGGNMLGAREIYSRVGVPVVAPEGLFGAGLSRRYYTQLKEDRVRDEELYTSTAQAMRILADLRNRFSGTVIAGFSNGGSFAATLALQAPHLVDEAWDFAGYIPDTEMHREFLRGRHPAREHLSGRAVPLPLRVYHSPQDLENPFEVTVRGVEALGAITGLEITLEKFHGGHTVCPEGFAALQASLNARKGA